MAIIGRYRPKYATKLIIAFSIFTVIIIGLSGILLLSKSKTIMIDEISKDSQYRLDNIRSFIDQTLMKKYEDFFLGKLLSSMFDVQNVGGIDYLLNHSPDENQYRIRMLNNDLHTNRMANEGISNISLYFAKSDYIVDADYYYAKTDKSPDAAFIATLPDLPINRWMFRTRGDDRPVFTYAFTLPHRAEGSFIKGYMYIDIDVEYVTAIIRGMLSASSESLAIFDRYNRLILTTAEDEADGQPSPVYGLSGERSGTEIVKSERNTTVYAYSPYNLSSNEWAYVVTRPLDSFLLSSKRLQRDIWGVSLIVLAVGLFSALLISRPFYMPLRRIITNIRLVHGGSLPFHPENEYKLIDSVLASLDTKVRSLNYKLRDNQVLHLIHGNMQEAGDIGFPTDACFVAVHFRLVNQTSHAFMDRYRQSDHSLSYEAVCNGPDTAVLLFVLESKPEDPYTLIRQEMRRFDAAMRGEFTYASGIGSIADSPEDIPLSYRHAMQAARYSYLYGTGAMIGYPEVASRSSTSLEFPFKTFENALEAADMEAVERFLNDCQTKLQAAGGVSVEVAELTFMQIITSLNKVVIKHQLHDLVEAEFDFYVQYRQETLDQGLALVREHCSKITTYIKGSSSHMHSETMKQIQHYIHQHMNEDISLESLSVLVSLSPSYISKLFSEVLHVSFIEYLTRTRMEQAAEYLSAESRTVTEIAEVVGYRNVQYFCTKFKSKYGITPLQYRMMQQRAEQGLES
ncbi:MAG: hypothetical protein K0Q59_4505 [Paenibacillus sp.]|nr:hypothetical protein [Paenibacillus sp.]